MQRFRLRSVWFAGWAIGLLLATSAASAAELISINSAGTDSGNALSGSSAISADGRFVVFVSSANNLGPTDTNGTSDVYVRDRQTGTTTLVSVDSAGTDSGNNSSSGITGISADGRFVVFESRASNLVGMDTNGTVDVFIRDLQSGTTTLVSVNSAGTDSGNGFSGDPEISADGRFVAFESTARNLAAPDADGTLDVFVRDLQLGTTTLVSVNSAGTDSGNSAASDAVISADGRFVAFESTASDLVGTDTNGTVDVFVRDLQLLTTTLVSVNSAGNDSGKPGFSQDAAISADGRFVVFRSGANDLEAIDQDVSGGFAETDVFVRDLQSGITTLVSVNSAGTDSGNGFSQGLFQAISADGRFVAFGSAATDLVATDTNKFDDIFVRDLQLGTTTLVSVNSTGTDSGNGPSFNFPLISDDGRSVVFRSSASDLGPTDTNAAADIYLRDLQLGTTTLVSVNSAGTNSGNNFSGSAVISAAAQFVAFGSFASDLVATDTNGTQDAFLFVNPAADTEGPVTSNVMADPNPAAINTPIGLMATVDDSTTGGSDIASAAYTIDGSAAVAMDASDASFDEVSEDVEATIPGFMEAGVHDVCVSGTDAVDNTGAEECIFLAVYDPTAGFVTGGGWITSPLGACQLTPDCTIATGKANFGFVSKYKKGANTPTGSTEFRFHAGDLNFHSNTYEWLVVANHRAQYKGVGTINGGGNYGFMLTVIDAALTPSTAVDLFRIKIWDKDNADTIVYDNQMGDGDSADPTTGIEGGSIMIHAK